MATTSDFRVETSRTERALIVTVSGDAGVSASGKMETEFTRVLVQRPPVVILDLSNMSFISSLAMGLLVSLHRGISGWRGRLIVAGAHDRVTEALRRAQLDRVLVMKPTVEAALADLGNPVSAG